MAPLMREAWQRPNMGPAEVLAQTCASYSNPQMQQHPQQNPQFNPAMHHPGQLNPQVQAHNFNAFQQNFLSPAQGSHLALPTQNSNPSASPATLSNHPTPSMQNLALQKSMNQGGPTSVSMVPQGSHQGTNPSAGATPGGSASASPNFTGKRRRASGVGVGVGEEVVEVNGVGGANKVKQSPRVGVKRQKGS